MVSIVVVNQNQFADLFDRIADLLEIKGDVVFKIRAYRRAAESIRGLGEDLATLRAEGRLKDVPGIGKAIEEKIGELIDTGKLRFLEELESEVPSSLLEILKVPDVGPRKAAMFWQQAGITTLADLEFAARTERLRRLPGMGEKSEARILAGIEALSRRPSRRTLLFGWEVANRWLAWLRALPEVKRAEAAGSLRRYKTTIGDIDLVAASLDPGATLRAVATHPDVAQVSAQGEAKVSVELIGGLRMQVWAQPPDRFGSLWQYATGSKEHNVRLRELAQRQGFSLSEKALLREDGQEELAADEESLYGRLGLPWIPPELREDRGELDAARENRLPAMIALSQWQAELHSHSTWSDGAHTIEEMARAAVERGLKLLAVTDHSASLGIAGGLNAARLAEQRLEIRRVEAELGGAIRLLQGIEVDILADGSLGLPDDALATLDIVIASPHSSFRQPREVATERMLRAIRHPLVRIIGHPTGRLLPDRDGMDLDWDMLLKAALEEGKILEINANPHRLDLDEVYARRAAGMGILLSVDTDAHKMNDLDQAVFGLSVARRAWVEARQVINTWPVEEIEQRLRRP